MKTKNKNFYSSILLGVMTLVFAAAFDGIADTFDNNVTEVCFQFDNGVDNPSNGQATNPELYDAVTGDPDCAPLPTTLCGICFDTTEFPLDGEQPNFADEDLARIVSENKDNTAINGIPYTDPISQKTVTLHFRALNQ